MRRSICFISWHRNCESISSFLWFRDPRRGRRLVIGEGNFASSVRIPQIDHASPRRRLVYQSFLRHRHRPCYDSIRPALPVSMGESSNRTRKRESSSSTTENRNPKKRWTQPGSIEHCDHRFENVIEDIWLMVVEKTADSIIKHYFCVCWQIIAEGRFQLNS
jgi:hypothetical protein